MLENDLVRCAHRGGGLGVMCDGIQPPGAPWMPGVGVYMLPWMSEMGVVGVGVALGLERGAGYEGVFVEVRVVPRHGLRTLGPGMGG